MKPAVIEESTDDKHAAITVGIKAPARVIKRLMSAVMTIPISIPMIPDMVSLNQDIFPMM
jgi:hypothetical protein